MPKFIKDNLQTSIFELIFMLVIYLWVIYFHPTGSKELDVLATFLVRGIVTLIASIISIIMVPLYFVFKFIGERLTELYAYYSIKF